jgi:hypothetical protein
LTGPRVLALVAARNEAASVGATVDALLQLPAVDEVLVVDDGSTDGTADAARAAGAWVLRLDESTGKGGAVAAGVASTSEIDVYLLVDADVGATAGAASALLGPVLDGTADMAVGVLPSAGDRAGFGTVRTLAAAGIRRACGFVADAPLSGQRAVRGELLRSLALAPRFGLETAMTIDAARGGARVVEVPVAMDHRHTGRSPAGFAHRGRQGADVVRALWSRLTTSRGRVGLIVAAVVAAAALALWSGSRWEPASVGAEPGSAAKVLLIGIPGLGFDDLASGATPNLDRMVATGAVGAMSVRTLSRHPQPSPEGYATLGAGSQVRAGLAAGDARNEGAGVLVPLAADVIEGAGSHRPSRPGALGDALHAAGKRTAVVGNADLAPGLSVPTISGRRITERPAAVALMDSEGSVDGGVVESGILLEPTDQAPFGWRADADQVVAATNLTLADADVVLVDPGDMDRAAALADIEAPARFTVPARDRALRDTDALVGRLTADLPSDTLVLVVSVVPPGAEWRLTPVVATGAGVVGGYLHSPSTKRLGLVTLTDVAPTVLDAVGADVPGALIGRPLRYHPGHPDLGRLVGLDRAAAFRQSIYYLTILGFIVFQAVVYLVVAGVLRAQARDGAPLPGWAGALRVAVLAVAAFPLATYLFRAVPFAPAWGWPAIAVLVAIAVAIALAASRTGRRSPRRPMAPLAWILGLTLAVLLVDVATGARLQLASLMGYSPETVARFYGVGNPTFAVLAATALLACALHLEHAPRRAEALVAVGAVLAFVVVVDGAPGLGDDVGGMLALPIVFTLAMVDFSGRRLSWRSVALALVAAAAVVALATVVDLVRAPDARSHLGRLAAETIQDGHGGLVTTVARKAEANFRVLRASVWSWLVPVIAAFGLFVLARGRGHDLLPPGSPRRTGLAAALAAGLLGFVVNDSGVIVTAVVLVFVGPFLAVAALAPRGRPRPVLCEPLTSLEIHVSPESQQPPPTAQAPSPAGGG